MKLPHFILNPTASAGKTGRFQAQLLDQIGEYFPGGFTLDVTTKPGHATEITRQALTEGIDLVVAIGGDGTINEVINGFFERGVRHTSAARMGLLCSGTAEDVARNLGLPSSLSDQVKLLTLAGTRSIDLGRATFRARGGGEETRLFINDCHPGIAAKVVQRVTPGLKRLGGFLAFGLASTFTALTYRGHVMKATLDGGETVEGRFLGIVVANGRYAGGGMDFAPHSRIDDGLLDIVFIRDQMVPARLFNFPKIYSGKHVELPWIMYKKARHLRIESEEQVELETDGELLGYLPCEVEVIPRALNVCTG